MTDTVASRHSASQWQLMWAKFKDHKLTLVSLGVLGVFYSIALLGPFLCPAIPGKLRGLPLLPRPGYMSSTTAA